MSGRPGRKPLQFLPDEARSLPPPKLTDPRLAYIGFLGYCSGLLDNAIRRRPVMLTGEGCAGGIRWEETGSGAAGRLRRKLPCLFRALSPSRPFLAFLGLPRPVSSSESRSARVSFGSLGNRGAVKPTTPQ